MWCKTCNEQVDSDDFLEHTSLCENYQNRLKESKRIYQNCQIPSNMNVRFFIREHFEVEPENRKIIVSKENNCKAITSCKKKRDWICPICLKEESCDTVKLNCNHIFCRYCIIRWLGVKKNCPMCKNLISS